MLERVWRKGNPLTLLVGLQTSTATMENSVEIPQKMEIELPYDPAMPLLGIHTEETRRERDTCTPPPCHGGSIKRNTSGYFKLLPSNGKTTYPDRTLWRAQTGTEAEILNRPIFSLRV